MGDFFDILNHTSPARVIWYSIVFIIALLFVCLTINDVFGAIFTGLTNIFKHKNRNLEDLARRPRRDEAGRTGREKQQNPKA